MSPDYHLSVHLEFSFHLEIISLLAGITLASLPIVLSRKDNPSMYNITDILPPLGVTCWPCVFVATS